MSIRRLLLIVIFAFAASLAIAGIGALTTSRAASRKEVGIVPNSAMLWSLSTSRLAIVVEFENLERQPAGIDDNLAVFTRSMSNSSRSPPLPFNMLNDDVRQYSNVDMYIVGWPMKSFAWCALRGGPRAQPGGLRWNGTSITLRSSTQHAYALGAVPFLLNLAIYSVVGYLLILPCAYLGRMRMRRQHRCPLCGYSLVGHNGPACPECGACRTVD